MPAFGNADEPGKNTRLRGGECAGGQGKVGPGSVSGQAAAGNRETCGRGQRSRSAVVRNRRKRNQDGQRRNIDRNPLLWLFLGLGAVSSEEALP